MRHHLPLLHAMAHALLAAVLLGTLSACGDGSGTRPPGSDGGGSSDANPRPPSDASERDGSSDGRQGRDSRQGRDTSDPGDGGPSGDAGDGGDAGDAGDADGSTPLDGFVHPGIVASGGQLEFVKARIAAGEEPWTSMLERARTSRVGQTTWVARPRAVVRCGNGPSDVDEGCLDSRQDALAAHTLALLWYHTGAQAYATAAIAILDAWSSTLTEIPFVSGDYDTYNGPLQAAWLAESFPRSAEILRHTESGWTPEAATRFGDMLNAVLVPRIADGWPDGGQNWTTSMANGMINIGVYNDDPQAFDIGVAALRLRASQNFHLASDGPYPIVPEEFANADGAWKPAKLTEAWYGQTEFGTERVNGITKETCRDFGHVQFALASVAYGAETAMHQGLDLYSELGERIVTSYEFVAGWHNLDPSSLTSRDYPTPEWVCPAQGHVELHELPTWEVGYNHFAGRLGMAMPETEALIARYRQNRGGPYTDLQMAWETLTHGDLGTSGLP